MNLFERIAKLNEEGVTLATKREYDDAEARHVEALEVATLAAAHVADHQMVSVANLAFIYRRRDADRRKAEDLLRSVVFSGSKTFFGRGRLFEEIALVLKYLPGTGAQRLNDFGVALENAEEAIDNYKHARDNTLPEIVDKDTIEDRLLRTTGIASTIATEVARLVSGDRRDRHLQYLGKAVEYAQQEVEGRLARGEIITAPLANAYHTLGVAQTELAKGDEEMYAAAKGNISRAFKLSPEDPMLLTVLTFRFAWLEYTVHPDSEKETIGIYVDKVLEEQGPMGEGRWDAGVKATLKDQMLTLGKHVGPPLQERVETFYAPAPAIAQ